MYAQTYIHTYTTHICVCVCVCVCVYIYIYIYIVYNETKITAFTINVFISTQLEG